MDRYIKIGALLATILAVAVDQSTKRWALTALRVRGGHLVLPGPIDFTFNVNESNAFGVTPVIGQATRWFLFSANLVVTVLILYVLMSKHMRPLTFVGLALIMAGAIGNALDRLFFGAVIDFLDATKVGFVWIFNVADVTLDAGIGLLLLSALLGQTQTVAAQIRD
jgi:signal peptidase II